MYQDRKARILQDFVATREVGESPFSAFLKAGKCEEDLRCFAMRLENLVDRTGVDPDNTRAMLIETLRNSKLQEKFCASLTCKAMTLILLLEIFLEE